MSASAYIVLGVSAEAFSDEIRRAYRDLVRKHHPDRHGGTEKAHERFLEIQAAYEILIDPEKRRAHDVDPSGTLASQLIVERVGARRRRRRARIKKLYD